MAPTGKDAFADYTLREVRRTFARMGFVGACDGSEKPALPSTMDSSRANNTPTAKEPSGADVKSAADDHTNTNHDDSNTDHVRPETGPSATPRTDVSREPIRNNFAHLSKPDLALA